MSDLFFSAVLFLGTLNNPYGFIALLAAVALGLSLIRKSYGLGFFVTIAATFGATHIIKSIAKVPRPDDAAIDALGYRFPSMHAAIAGAVIASLAWHLMMRTDRFIFRVLIVAAASVVIALACATRVYLGVHELIDVCVGALLGASLGVIIHALMRKLGLE
jgi:membrane-associated phospholipid phosphatase